MSLPPEAQQPSLAITFELDAEGSYEADIAMIYTLGRDITTELQRNGATIRPVQTGQRGGELLVQIITAVTDLAVQAWTNKEIVLGDLAGLVTVCTPIGGLLLSLVKTYQKHTTPLSSTPQAVKITIEIDGKPITVEAADVEQAKSALEVSAKVVQHFAQQHPTTAKQVTPQSTARVQGRIPPQPQRKRR